jgi:CheY-like chemotaxis protein
MDDVRLLAEFAGTALGRADCEISVAAPDEDLAETAVSLRPDLVVLGERESCPDALEACRRIRAHPATRTTPVIFIGIGLDRRRFAQAGVTQFLFPPVSRLALQAALSRVLPLRERLARRRRVDLPARLALADRLLEGRCLDLSFTGAFLDVDAPVGSVGRLGLELGGGRVELEALVVRGGRGLARVGGVGVAFTGTDAAISAYLSRFVRAGALEEPPARNAAGGAP